MERHIKSIEEKCRTYFCQNLDIVESMSKERQKKNRWLQTHAHQGAGALLMDSSPRAYCQITHDICVAEDTSFFEGLFGKTDYCLGVELSRKRLCQCPSRKYKKT